MPPPELSLTLKPAPSQRAGTHMALPRREPPLAQVLIYEFLYEYFYKAIMSNIAIAGTLQMQLGGCQSSRTCPGEPPAPNPCLPLSPQPCPSPRAAAVVSPNALHRQPQLQPRLPLGCLSAGSGWLEKAASHFDYFPQLCCKSHFNHGFPLYQVNGPILADRIAKAETRAVCG